MFLECLYLFIVSSYFLSLPQKTGWSALHFSAERGDSATAEMLLKAGANAHLKDKVCHLSITHLHFLLIFFIYFFSLERID